MIIVTINRLFIEKPLLLGLPAGYYRFKMHPPAGSPIDIYRFYAWINVKPRHMAYATDLYHAK